MKKPNPLRKEQLEPKADVARKSKWNGDKRRTQTEQGFATSRASSGLTVVDGTRPQSRVKPVEHGRHAGAHAPMTRLLKMPEEPLVFESAKRRNSPPSEPFDPPALKSHQADMLTPRAKREKKRGR